MDERCSKVGPGAADDDDGIALSLAVQPCAACMWACSTIPSLHTDVSFRASRQAGRPTQAGVYMEVGCAVSAEWCLYPFAAVWTVKVDVCVCGNPDLCGF